MIDFTNKDSKVFNLGCRLNYFESGIIKKILDQNKVSKKIVINTCAVTNNAVKKSISEIRRVKKKYPNYEVYVTGCASQIEKEKFEALKEVDKVISNKYKTENFSYVKTRKITQKDYKFPELFDGFTERTRASLQIQQGCNHRCTFCIIPFGRGEARSLPVGEISNRLKKLIQMGFKEVTLTGVDLTSFGEDLPGKPKLGSVLKRLLNLHPKLKRLRLSSIDPAEMDDELLDLFKFNKRILPYLHLSIQSGDNLILKRMRRRHTREKVMEICNKLKSVRNEIKFGADLIVGFPTENHSHFKNTLNLVEYCRFSNLHLFRYSPKNGTPAAKMPQVSNDIKNLRYSKLLKTQTKIKSSLMKSKIGNIEEILFESNNQSYTNDYFKVSLLKNNRNSIEPGSLIKVKITSKKKENLLAKII